MVQRILVVDDNRELQKLVRSALEHPNHLCLICVICGCEANSPRLLGRISSLLILLVIVTGIFAQAFVSDRLIVSGDAAATARNILANQGLYRLGFTVFLVEMVAQIAKTALWYVLLRPVNRSIALSAAFIDLAGGVIKTFARVFYIVPLWVLLPTAGGASPVLRGFTPEQVQSIALVLLQINNRGAGAALAFFGFSITLNGYLIFRSTFMPRWLGLLSMISGLGWLTFLYPPSVRVRSYPSCCLLCRVWQ